MDSRHAHQLRTAERTFNLKLLESLPTKPPPANTPCDRCPKMALWEDWQPGQPRGLHPGNKLAVDLYYYARDDQRVGVFDSAPLCRTITLPSVKVILDEFAEHLPTWMARQNMLTKILIMDQEATQARSEEEERRRVAREAADKAKANR